VGDVVAHVTDIEDFMAGNPRPDHAPDLSALPHVRNPFGEITEVGVDYRRGRPRADVVAELRALIPVRREQARAMPPDVEVLGPTLRMMTPDRLFRMRAFDTWVHEQDIRAAIGQDGGWGVGGARLSYQQMTRAIPFMWSKGVEAPVGAVLRLQITGPDLEGEYYARVDDDGKGVASGASDATVTARMSWPDYAALSAGRVDPDVALPRVELDGDLELGQRLVREMAITP
jgi:uncharacterized protein (TIGR03083 family)